MEIPSHKQDTEKPDIEPLSPEPVKKQVPEISPGVAPPEISPHPDTEPEPDPEAEPDQESP